MLTLRNLAYAHPGKDVLFTDISLTVNDHRKTGLTGDNGTGKSTLLKIISGKLQPSAGQIFASAEPYYVPQLFGQYNHLTVAEALGVDRKLHALTEILSGNPAEENFTALNDDWTLEDRCREALQHWQLNEVALTQKMETLSGGQKTKVFLAGIFIHQPTLVLLDEPSNHLDVQGRELLYDFVQSTNSSLLVVSHDRALLNRMDTICELGKTGVTVYGGNYDFYAEQKKSERDALSKDIQEKEKSLRKAKEKERETAERRNRLDNRGKKKQEKAGVARIMMNTLRNSAENSTAKTKSVHAEKIDGLAGELQELRGALPDIDKMKFGFDDSPLHKGKIIFGAEAVNVRYDDRLLWKQNLDVSVISGERISLKGKNGSGKTTLIKLILGELEPSEGTIYRAVNNSVYIDQDYSLVNNTLTVYEQAQQFNDTALEEHEVKTRLNRFLFTKTDWDKSCAALSGGERMRLLLACMNIRNLSPDLIVLDEPVNNLDIQNVEILTAAINEYKGTLVVVSHDERFLQEINVARTIEL